MSRLLCCLSTALLSLALVATQGAHAKAPAKRHAPVKSQPQARTATPKPPVRPLLTAEQYRDLIVNTADAVDLLQHPVRFGKGIEKIPDPATYRETIYFLFDKDKAKSAAQEIASLRRTWVGERVPAPLQVSHREISEWMARCQTKLEHTPFAAPGGSLELAMFLADSACAAGYSSLRKNAATALAGMGVTLPDLPKK